MLETQLNKSDSIKLAYGDHYDNLVNYIDKNGWCGVRRKVGFEEIRKTLEIQNDTWNAYKWRPKSLNGIERNGLWNKPIVFYTENKTYRVYCKDTESTYVGLIHRDSGINKFVGVCYYTHQFIELTNWDLYTEFTNECTIRPYYLNGD